MQAAEQRLIVVIASDADADRIVHSLVEQGYPATKIGSTGGFLRKGNATVFSGVDAGEVEGVLSTIRAECPAHTEELLPALGAAPFLEPVTVRAGGAIVFVLPVERFEKT